MCYGACYDHLSLFRIDHHHTIPVLPFHIHASCVVFVELFFRCAHKMVPAHRNIYKIKYILCVNNTMSPPFTILIKSFDNLVVRACVCIHCVVCSRAVKLCLCKNEQAKDQKKSASPANGIPRKSRQSITTCKHGTFIFLIARTTLQTFTLIL